MDHKNIEEVVDLYSTKVQSVIRKFLKNSHDVEDVKQEVLIRTWKNLPKYRGDSNMWGWINRITVNACKDHLRSSKKFSFVITDEEEDDIIQNLPDKNSSADKNLLSKERHKQIIEAINRLNKKHREVLILHDIEELTYEEISTQVNCPVGTVKSRLFNARKELKQELDSLLS